MLSDLLECLKYTRRSLTSVEQIRSSSSSAWGWLRVSLSSERPRSVVKLTLLLSGQRVNNIGAQEKHGQSSNTLLCLTLAALFGISGCVTTEKKEVKIAKKIIPTHYTLRLGEKQENHPPLPSYTPIVIDWHYSNGAIVSKLGYKGWDFNRDGRFDMLQILGEGAVVDFTVFDFDLDGQIDMKK